MNRKVLCLFFLCLLVCTGCEKELDKEPQRKQEEMETTAGTKEVLVLIDGGQEVESAAESVCEKMQASYYDISLTPKEEVEAAVRKADYVLIGTQRARDEFEKNIRQCLEKEVLEDKKVSLFLLDMEEEKEEMVKAFTQWYPNALILPAFSMRSDLELQEEELGRMNGWLTTVFTYDIDMENDR